MDKLVSSEDFNEASAEAFEVFMGEVLPNVWPALDADDRGHLWTLWERGGPAHVLQGIAELLEVKVSSGAFHYCQPPGSQTGKLRQYPRVACSMCQRPDHMKGR